LFRTAPEPFILLNIYRPPTSPPSTFFNELADLLVDASLFHSGAVILCGDVNCPGTTSGNVHDGLQQLLHQVNFKQYISSPTRNNNILDIFACTEHNSPVLSTQVINSHQLSDHNLILSKLQSSVISQRPTTRSMRCLKNVDFAQFDRALLTSSLTVTTDNVISVGEYTRTIIDVVIKELDKVAPLRLVKHSPLAKRCDSFITRDVRDSIRERRRLERLWNRTGDDIVRQRY